MTSLNLPQLRRFPLSIGAKMGEPRSGVGMPAAADFHYPWCAHSPNVSIPPALTRSRKASFPFELSPRYCQFRHRPGMMKPKQIGSWVDAINADSDFTQRAALTGPGTNDYSEHRSRPTTPDKPVLLSGEGFDRLPS